jgi:hypothetical protein
LIPISRFEIFVTVTFTFTSDPLFISVCAAAIIIENGADDDCASPAASKSTTEPKRTIIPTAFIIPPDSGKYGRIWIRIVAPPA